MFFGSFTVPLSPIPPLQYFLFTHTIRDASQFHIVNMHQAVRALSETITASAWSLPNASFPLVTTPVFEVHGDHARVQSGIELIVYTPLVKAAEQAAWNVYSVENQGWIEESRDIVAESSDTDGEVVRDSFTIVQNTPIPEEIWEYAADGTTPIASEGRGPFCPVWTMSPPPVDPSFVNFNMLSRHEIQVLYPVVSLTRGTL